MTLVASYSQVNARVDLTTTGLQTAGAAIFSIQRAPTASGPWTGVRGAVNQTVVGNGAQVWPDYEFDAGPGVTNYYRVIAQAAPSFIGFGTPNTGANGGGDVTLTPAWHASTAAGDVILLSLVASVTGIVEWPPTPSGTGWVLVSAGDFDATNVSNGGSKRAIWMKQVLSGDVGPTSVFLDTFGMAGAVHGAQAQTATFRNVRPVVLNQDVAPVSAQPATTSLVRFPAVTVPEAHALIVALAYSSDTIAWTSVATTAGWTAIDDNGFARANLDWQFQVQGAAANIGSTDLVITGGTHSPSEKAGNTLVIGASSTSPTTVLFTDNEPTPLDVVWLKDPRDPTQNRIVTVASPTQIQHAARSGLFDIKGRAEPIEVSEIRRSRAWTQRWVFTTFTELDALLELFASGRTLFLQVPARGTLPDCPPWPRSLPGGYISVGTVSEETAPDAPLPGTITAPVQTVAAPAPELDVVAP